MGKKRVKKYKARVLIIARGDLKEGSGHIKCGKEWLNRIENLFKFVWIIRI